METFKKCLPDLIAVVLFAVIAFAYFFPADIEGRILYQHDTSAGRGAGQETAAYYQRTGERTRWTNSLFGGMPTYQISPSYSSTDGLAQVSKAYHLWLPDNVWYVFVYLLGFYILLRAFNFRQSLAALGAIVWAFSSYFFIIIAAGHIWKVWALAYLPPLIAGIVLAYRGKYLAGFLVTALFTAFEVLANHVQMTYYYLMVILFMVIAFLVEAVQKKQLARFLKASAVCVAAGAPVSTATLRDIFFTDVTAEAVSSTVVAGNGTTRPENVVFENCAFRIAAASAAPVKDSECGELAGRANGAFRIEKAGRVLFRNCSLAWDAGVAPGFNRAFSLHDAPAPDVDVRCTGLSMSARTVTSLSGDGWTADGEPVSVPHTWNAVDGADGLGEARGASSRGRASSQRPIESTASPLNRAYAFFSGILPVVKYCSTSSSVRPFVSGRKNAAVTK